MDIIWSCLVTIFACSWTATHPMVPGLGDYSDSKVWLCGMAVIAPEVLAINAVGQYMSVRGYFKTIKLLNKGQWSMSQLFFVYMGGVKLEFEDCTETLGFAAHSLLNRDRALDLLRRTIQLDILNVESISVEDVRKRAKTNHLAKALACLQASWLVTQVIGRAVARFPITTLEVVTVGYVVCALTSYAFWWHKPQDAEVQITVNCRNFTRTSFHQQLDAVSFQLEREVLWEMVLVCVLSGTFGAIHCTAWDFYFSTSAEAMIWRISSILTVVIPTFGFFAAYNPNYLPYWLDSLAVKLLLVYIPVRLYLMIEPFVAFRSVPVGIFYTVDWSTWIPHV
jgi:hypothetical protein